MKESKQAVKSAYAERVDGPTPNGGAYAVAYYIDKEGNKVDHSVAVRGEIVEYDSKGGEIFRTYFSVYNDAT